MATGAAASAAAVDSAAPATLALLPAAAVPAPVTMVPATVLPLLLVAGIPELMALLLLPALLRVRPVGGAAADVAEVLALLLDATT